MRNTVSLSVIQSRNCHVELSQSPFHSGLNKGKHVLGDVLEECPYVEESSQTAQIANLLENRTSSIGVYRPHKEHRGSVKPSRKQQQQR